MRHLRTFEVSREYVVKFPLMDLKASYLKDLKAMSLKAHTILG